MLSVILILLLSSCSVPKKNESPVLSGISFQAEVTRDSKTEIFLVKFHKNGDCELSFTKDGEPTGVGIFFSKNGANCFLNGTKLETNIGLLNEGLYADFIYSVFSAARNCKIKYSDGLPIIENTNGKYDFVITLSGSGLPLSIKEKNFGILCKLERVTID